VTAHAGSHEGFLFYAGAGAIGGGHHCTAQRSGSAHVNPAPETRQRPALLLALGAVLLIRLLSLGAYPLTDTTEARYGEIVRKMVAVRLILRNSNASETFC
jgi:hypothetical protein